MYILIVNEQFTYYHVEINNHRSNFAIPSNECLNTHPATKRAHTLGPKRLYPQPPIAFNSAGHYSSGKAAKSGLNLIEGALDVSYFKVIYRIVSTVGGQASLSTCHHCLVNQRNNLVMGRYTLCNSLTYHHKVLKSCSKLLTCQ